MSLHQRTSANTSRRAHNSSLGPTGLYHGQPVPPSPAERNYAAEDFDTDLRDNLQKAHTKLNRANEERDKLKAALEQATRKIAESGAAYRELQTQLQTAMTESEGLKVKNRELETDNKRLEFERCDFEKRLIGLEAKYENLSMRHNGLKGNSSPNVMSAVMTERPKVARAPSKVRDEKKPSRDEKKPPREDKKREESRRGDRHREDRHREDRHREDRHRDDGHREERHRGERGRARDKDKDKDKREAKAEKDKARWSKRFDERPPTTRRESFIEPWGPSGTRSPSTAPSPGDRAYTSVATTTSRMQAPAVATSHQASYSSVPRTPHPMSPGNYSSNSSGVFDDDNYEDGSYYPHPIVS